MTHMRSVQGRRAGQWSTDAHPQPADRVDGSRRVRLRYSLRASAGWAATALVLGENLIAHASRTHAFLARLLIDSLGTRGEGLSECPAASARPSVIGDVETLSERLPALGG